MHVRVSLVSLVLFLLVRVLNAETVALRGVAPGGSGQVIEVFYITNLITGQQVFIGNIIPDNEDHFSFEVAIDDTEVIYLRWGIFDHYLFVSPGREYNLILPPFSGLSDADRNNPYFVRKRYHLKDSDDESLNNLIREFDLLYYSILDRVEEDIYFRRNRDNLDSLVSLLESSIRKTDHEYYSLFTRCRIYNLRLFSSRTSSFAGQAINFLNDKFDHRNTACIMLLKELFNGILTGLLSGDRAVEIRQLINSKQDLLALTDIIRVEYGIDNREMLEYLVLFNLYNEYYASTFRNDAVYRLLKIAVEDAASQEGRELAEQIVNKIDRLRKGNTPPGFRLADEDGNVLSPDSLSGKYTILTFGESGSWQTLSEYNLLTKWYSTYSKDLQIVTILVDRNFNEGIKKMRKLGYQWIILDGSDSGNLQRLYEVKFFPSFYLLDRQGRIVSAPAPFPSENLKSLLLENFQRDLIEDIRN